MWSTESGWWIPSLRVWLFGILGRLNNQIEHDALYQDSRDELNKTLIIPCPSFNDVKLANEATRNDMTSAKR